MHERRRNDALVFSYSPRRQGLTAYFLQIYTALAGPFEASWVHIHTELTCPLSSKCSEKDYGA